MTTATVSETAQPSGGNGPRSPFYLSLGKSLRGVRELKRMSLQDVENLSGGRFDTSRLASYEKGNRRPNLETLCELAAFYDIPASRFLPDSEGSLPDPLGDVIALLEGLRGSGK